jgi:FHA domain/FhaA, N-terminal domain
MRFIRKAGAPAEKSPKRLHVEPAELARKLVKEMDDHAVERGDKLFARNRYVIYLCREDYDSLIPRRAQVTADLTSKLARHVRDMRYTLQGDLAVELVLDEELELGYFGILAQRAYGQQPAPEPAPAGAPAAEAAVAGAPPPAPLPGSVPAGAAAAAGVAATAPAQAGPADMNIPASTEVIAAEQAAELGLARKVIVVTIGDQVREFTQSRVVLGRSKEADLRIDDPNVSRKHAAIYWSNGRLVLEDLGSTNGTMVNGYPVTSTVLKPRDVVAIGESRLTVESR